MENRLKIRIEMLDAIIDSRTKKLDRMVENLKSSISNYGTFQIVTFIPSKVREIEQEYNEIKKLIEEKHMLRWIAGEE